MSITQQNGVCPAILAGVEELLSPNAPTNLMTPVGAVQALLDPENTRGVTMEQLGEGDNGHRKTVRIWHKQRAIPDDLGDEKNCDPGTAKPRFEETFDVDLHTQHVVHIDEATVRTLCDAYSQLVRVPVASRDSDGRAIDSKAILRELAEDLMMDLDPIRQKINENYLTALALNFGDWKGGDSSKTFNVIGSNDHAVVLTGFNQLKQELKKIGMGGMPLVFGGGNIDLAFSALELGCCNDIGQDFGKMSKNAGFKFYFDDSDMNTLLGNANAFGILQPKAAQFVTFNKYVGSFARPHGLTERGTMPDPKLPGIRYDIRIVPNECAEEGWDMFVNLDYGFYFAPTNLYKSGDRLEGVNGLFKAIAAAV